MLFYLFRRSGLAIGNVYGEGSGQIWLDNVDCDGDEDALGDCDHNNWGSNNCDHDEDVAITCSTNLTNNIGKIYNGTFNTSRMAEAGDQSCT